jgi:type II secretory pathway pseudopilin PulG
MCNLLNKINKLHRNPNKQQGAALMVMLVIVVVGATTLLLSSLTSSALKNERDQNTNDALVLAKNALIGYSIKSITPGQLPCPENTALIGSPTEGTARGTCTLPAIGRLPWRTLGIGPIHDASGELLWYAISPGFRTPPINSNTPAQLTVDGISNRAAAIIFSAGYPINGQSRPTPTSGTPPDVTQYLDLSNNDGDNTFATTGPADTFNDRLLIISHTDIFQLAELRVAKELQNTFSIYMANNLNRYPNPANLNCTTSANCNSDTSQCRGWIPITANLDQPHWILPSWFASNEWYRIIYYSASSTRLASIPTGCNISISSSATQALFIMSGTPNISQTRPSNNLLDYLEDTENTNLDDAYVMPTTSSNDHLYVLP